MELQLQMPPFTRPRYPSDVSDEEWAFVVPYLTLCREDAPQRKHDLREVFNAVRWLVRTGAQWRFMPQHFPPWAACYQQTQRWIQAGVFEAMVHDLRLFIRMGEDRAPDPTAVICDARTLQSTPTGGTPDPGATDEAGAAQTSPIEAANAMHALRRALLSQNPDLFALRMASMHQFEDQLCAVVERRLRTDEPEIDDAQLRQRARLVTYVAFAGMRHAWSCWADKGGVGPLADQLRSSFEQLQTIGSRALAHG